MELSKHEKGATPVGPKRKPFFVCVRKQTWTSLLLTFPNEFMDSIANLKCS